MTKDEPILNNDTVNYQSYDMIEETLKYDFQEEKEQNYIDFNEEELIDRICEFTSRIWQVQPFQEGNTRTTAIFIQKYLISMGFKVNNELFKDNSKSRFYLMMLILPLPGRPSFFCEKERRKETGKC